MAPKPGIISEEVSPAKLALGQPAPSSIVGARFHSSNRGSVFGSAVNLSGSVWAPLGRSSSGPFRAFGPVWTRVGPGSDHRLGRFGDPKSGG